MDPKWQNLATTDVDKILAWDKETPSANCACVAKADGVLFFEADEDDVIGRYEQETGEILPEMFAVESRPGSLSFLLYANTGVQGLREHLSKTNTLRQSATE